MKMTRKSVPKRSEDSILLAKFVSENDQDAFAQIVRKYESLVWNVCCRVLHNRHDAEDAFQQTFLLLASKARRIRKPRSLSSWLYGVAFRVASSIRRQRQRDMLPYETSVDPRLTDNVLEYVARKNENELVSAEIMLMKEKHKRPLLMFYFMGDSTAQIADTLGITVSAVEGRLRQARQALRSQLILRGIDFETTFAALLLPVLSLSPSLTVATTNKIAAASMSGFAGIIHSYLTGYNQTGDEDAILDNQTTIILAPGDVNLEGDFGYQPDGTVAASDIGSTIYIDANADGTHDADEPGIAGVTVTLLDGNGDAIATMTTDENGNYLFPDLPNGDYTVVVSDTENVLNDLDNSADPDGGTANESNVTLTGDDLNQNFG